MLQPTLVMPILLAPTPSPFATTGAEEFDAAVRTIESRAVPGHDKGPLAVHADGDIYGFGGVVNDFRSDEVKHPSGPDSWRRILWEARYPGIAAIEDDFETPAVESPAWNGTRYPVSIDRVVSDFLRDGATETFCALPRPAQKIIALRQIANELKRKPHLLAGFADLAANTLRSVGFRITYETAPCDVRFTTPEKLDGWEHDTERNEFWHETRELMDEVVRNVSPSFERVTFPGQDLEYYVSANKVAAVVGPYGIPLPAAPLLKPDQYGSPRFVIMQMQGDEHLIRVVDTNGKLAPYSTAQRGSYGLYGVRRIMEINNRHHSVLVSGMTVPIPEKAAANAYCVESGRRCFVAKSGDAWHFIAYYDGKGNGDKPCLPDKTENTVVWNDQLYLRQTDGSFTLAADGYYAGRRLWQVADGQAQEVSANARDQVFKNAAAPANIPDFFDNTEVFFDPVLRQPIAFWHAGQRQWILLGSTYRAVNPEYNGQRYFVPEDIDGRYYTSAELASPVELDGTIYTDEQIQAARRAALKKLGLAG